jgi:hypothetical protein
MSSPPAHGAKFEWWCTPCGALVPGRRRTAREHRGVHALCHRFQKLAPYPTDRSSLPPRSTRNAYRDSDGRSTGVLNEHMVRPRSTHLRARRKDRPTPKRMAEPRPKHWDEDMNYAEELPTIGASTVAERPSSGSTRTSGGVASTPPLSPRCLTINTQSAVCPRPIRRSGRNPLVESRLSAPRSRADFPLTRVRALGGGRFLLWSDLLRTCLKNLYKAPSYVALGLPRHTGRERSLVRWETRR